MPENCKHCDKLSCLPAGYPPRCSRHYMLDLKDIDAAQKRRLAAVCKALGAGKRDEALRIWHTPLNEFRRTLA